MLLVGSDEPDYHVDISAHMQTKLEAVLCHASQLGNRGPDEIRKAWEERMRSSSGGPPRESFKRVSIRRPPRQQGEENKADEPQSKQDERGSKEPATARRYTRELNGHRATRVQRVHSRVRADSDRVGVLRGVAALAARGLSQGGDGRGHDDDGCVARAKRPALAGPGGDGDAVSGDRGAVRVARRAMGGGGAAAVREHVGVHDRVRLRDPAVLRDLRVVGAPRRGRERAGADDRRVRGAGRAGRCSSFRWHSSRRRSSR